MSDSLQVFLLSFLGFMVSFSIVFLAIRVVAVNIAHREFGPPKIHIDQNVGSLTAEELRSIDERLGLGGIGHIPIRPSPCERIYQGNMLEALKNTKHLSVNQDGQLEEK